MTPRQQLRSPCFSAGSSQGAVMTVSAGQNSARPCRGPGAARSFDPGAQARPFGVQELVQSLGLPFPCLGPFPGLCGPFFGPGSGRRRSRPAGLLPGSAWPAFAIKDGCSLRPSAACLVKSSAVRCCGQSLAAAAFPLFFLIAIEAQALAHRQLRWHRPEIGRLSPGIHGRVQRPHGHVLGVRALLARSRPKGLATASWKSSCRADSAVRLPISFELDSLPPSCRAAISTCRWLVVSSRWMAAQSTFSAP